MGENMSDKSNYVPIRVKIEHYYRFYEDIASTNHYDINGNKKYDFSLGQTLMKAPPYEPNAVEFNEDLFNTVQEISKTENVKHFIGENSYLCLKFFITHRQEPYYITMDEYIDDVLKELNIFRRFYSIAKALNAYHESSSLYLESEAKEVASKTLEACIENEKGILYDSSGQFISVFEDIIPIEDDSGWAIERADLDVSNMHFKEIRSWILKCEESFDRFLSEKIGAVGFSGIHADGSVECCCHSLIEAIYEYALISIINRNEYRKCSKPGCNRYYKVDKHHPQKFCDEHMASRRKKRQNAAIKKNAAT